MLLHGIKMLVNVIVCFPGTKIKKSQNDMKYQLFAWIPNFLSVNVDTACRSSTEIRPFIAKIKLKKGICWDSILLELPRINQLWNAKYFAAQSAKYLLNSSSLNSKVHVLTCKSAPNYEKNKPCEHKLIRVLYHVTTLIPALGNYSKNSVPSTS